MRSPRHHLLLLGMAGHALPPVFKSPPQSRRMGTPVVRWVGRDPRGNVMGRGVLEDKVGMRGSGESPGRSGEGNVLLSIRR